MPALDVAAFKSQALADHGGDRDVHYMRYFFNNYRNSPMAKGRPGLEWLTQEFPDYYALHGRRMKAAEMFYVSTEMCKLVTAAAERLPEDTQIAREDFPSDIGLMYVPNGLVSMAINGNTFDGKQFTTITSAVLWHITGHIAHFTYLVDKQHERGMLKRSTDEELFRVLPRATVWHEWQWDLSQGLPTTYNSGFLVPPGETYSVNEIDNNLAVAFAKGYDREELPEVMRQMIPGPRKDPFVKWIISALRIMQQPIASVERKGLPRHVRAGLPRKLPKGQLVTVIEFRRAAVDFTEGTGREFSHRFLRRGHWRSVRIKNEDGTYGHRKVWIHPTIVLKDRTDLPFIARDHVNALQR